MMVQSNESCNFDPICSENEILSTLSFITDIRVLLVEIPNFETFLSVTVEQMGADE